MAAATRTLPILDLGRFASAHPEREQALAELRDVSRTLGFSISPDTVFRSDGLTI
ncbi:isopenicillin N synthase-like dioxygenase [Rhizobium leguminosarum]